MVYQFSAEPQPEWNARLHAKRNQTARKRNGLACCATEGRVTVEKTALRPDRIRCTHVLQLRPPGPPPTDPRIAPPVRAGTSLPRTRGDRDGGTQDRSHRRNADGSL